MSKDFSQIIAKTVTRDLEIAIRTGNIDKVKLILDQVKVALNDINNLGLIVLIIMLIDLI